LNVRPKRITIKFPGVNTATWPLVLFRLTYSSEICTLAKKETKKKGEMVILSNMDRYISKD
jgi:hypothetical protein